jgi:hypothetical protein
VLRYLANVLIGLLAVVGVLALVSLALTQRKGAETVQAVPTYTNTPQPAPTAPPTERPTPSPTLAPTHTPCPDCAPPFHIVCRQDERMTAVQKEAQAAQYVGQRVVDWLALVWEVREAQGRYTVYLSMQSPPQWDSWHVKAPDIPPEQALRLRVQQPVHVSGRIADIDIVWGEICSPLTLADAVIVE